MTTFSLTKAFEALLGSVSGVSTSESFAKILSSGHLESCPTKATRPCFWCAAAAMTPELVAASALWDAVTRAVNEPVASWPRAIRARMAIYDLADLQIAPNQNAQEFAAEFLSLVHAVASQLDTHLASQGSLDSELEYSARQAAALTALPILLTQPDLAPQDRNFRTRLSGLSSTDSSELQTMAMLATEQLLAGQFMEPGAGGRALANLAPYLGDSGTASFADLAWVAGYFAHREQLLELAEELMDLEHPSVVVEIPPVLEHYRLQALQTFVLRAQPINWATTFVHVTGGSGWKCDLGYLVTPSTAISLRLWNERGFASAIGYSQQEVEK